ncbi:hypothetical protein M569_16503, partial [Genlisea aurea]
IKTIKVSNIAKDVSERDVFELFTFSGAIQYIEMQRSSATTTQVAYVTFRDSHEADTTTLLTGAVISGIPVAITLADNYQLPSGLEPATVKYSRGGEVPNPNTAAKKAEEMVSALLAKGYALGKDALLRAKSFDERHRIVSNASATVSSIDRKIGLSEKISMGSAAVNEKVREMDERFQVSEKTKSAVAAAEQKASTLMSNQYVLTGASWVNNAITAVSKAAEDVSVKAKEKVEKAEEEEKGGSVVSEFTNDH